jgi:hypothetical protein
MIPIEIKLSNEEKTIAKLEAKRRQSDNESKNIKGRNGGEQYGAKALKMHLYGSFGEMAVASYLNLKEYLYLEKIAVRGSCDLPYDIDVKTRSEHWHDLIIQLDDDPKKIFVLVTINKNCFIHGWIKGEDIMNKKYIKDPAKGRKAYFIPSEELKPMEDLIKIINHNSVHIENDI